MIEHSSFTGQGTAEHFFAGTALPGKSFSDEMVKLFQEYEEALSSAGCSPDSELLLRFHLSDVSNQAPFLRKFLKDRNSFISVLGQPPATGARIALEAWHWSGVKKSRAGNALNFSLPHYSGSWFGMERIPSADSFQQMAFEFSELKKHLDGAGAACEKNTVRTWIYCRDVDNNYSGLVKARNVFFAENGLTKDTHFISSTGIEGQSEQPDRLVKMDSIHFYSIDSRQLVYLSAPEMLSPTAIYGVSFERGTRMIFGDRSHYYISGTASIDKYGKVLFLDDVLSQTQRLLDNVEALLKSSCGSLQDLKTAVVYLRDSADKEIVSKEIKKRIPSGLPCIFVKAPVCRPTWLVEMEAFGVNSFGNPMFRSF